MIKSKVFKCLKNHYEDIITRKLRENFENIINNKKIAEFKDSIILYEVFGKTIYVEAYRGNKFKGSYLLEGIKFIDKLAIKENCNKIIIKAELSKYRAFLRRVGYLQIPNTEEMYKCVIQ